MALFQNNDIPQTLIPKIFEGSTNSRRRIDLNDRSFSMTGHTLVAMFHTHPVEYVQEGYFTSSGLKGPSANDQLVADNFPNVLFGIFARKTGDEFTTMYYGHRAGLHVPSHLTRPQLEREARIERGEGTLQDRLDSFFGR
jgi:hypothetical protein